MKTLKIVMVTNNYWPYSGGVVSSIDAFARELLEQGHHVTIITFDFLKNYSHQTAVSGLEIIRIPCLFRFLYKKNCAVIPWRYHRAVLKIIAHIKPDIIHAQHPFLLGVAALKAARSLSIPIVFTYHTQYEQYAHYVPLPVWLTKPVIQTLVKRYCQKIDYIIVPSQSIKTIVEKTISVKCAQVSSGILPEYQRIQQPIKELKKTFTLLCVSRFAQEKSIDKLIDMYGILRSNLIKQRIAIIPHLQLIGYGAELLSLRSYAYDILQFDENDVSFIERPPKNVIAEYYRNADLFVFASQTETQGIVLAEAMASATPVIALDGPGQKDIVINGKNGYLVDNIHEMAQRVINLIQNHSLLKELQDGAFATAYSYMPRQVTRDLLKIYDVVLSSKE